MLLLSSGRARGGWRRGLIMGYDRLYRFFHQLDRPDAEVGPALCLQLTRCRRARRLPDGTALRRGDLIGVLHLNNARIAHLHAEKRSVQQAVLAFRRQFFASLHALAVRARPGGPLAGVRAYTATTILHDHLRRVGFQADPGGVAWPRLVARYQRALLTSLHPGARLRRASYERARRMWLGRDALVTRFAEPRARRAKPSCSVAPGA